MRYRRPFLAMILGLSLVFGLAKIGYAQAPGDAWTLQPGGSATITFETFCLDYGLLFPPTVGLPQATAVEPAVTSALNYALSKGYTTSQAEQTQLAIWRARGAAVVPELAAAGQEISANLNVPPAAPAGATSVLDAVGSGQATATLLSFGSTGARLSFISDAFQGRGELRIDNVSGNALTLYMPVGTYFPATGAGYQNMIGYLAGVQITQPAQAPTNTAPAPTNTAQAPVNTPLPATATPLPATATPLPATATSTPAPTNTAAPTATTAATGTPAAVTTTPAAPTATVPAPTNAPAVQPTATGVVSGGGFEITPTTQPAPAAGGGQMMPDTGVPLQQWSLSQIIVAIVLGLDVVALGYVLRRRSRRQ
jgi:hypothetical protein